MSIGVKVLIVAGAVVGVAYAASCVAGAVMSVKMMKSITSIEN